MDFNRVLELAGLPPVEKKEVVIEGAVEINADIIIGGIDVEAEIVAAAEAEIVVEEASAPDLEKEKEAPKVKVPADITAAITARVAELKRAIEDFDDGGVKPNAIEALEQIAEFLKQEDGLTKANVYYGTLMSPITDLFPPKVVKFVHSAK